MPPMETLTKTANSLLRGTEDVALSPIKGIWVGGKITADASGVSFAPNGVNKAIHPVDTTWHLDYDQIRAVRVRFGVVTKIVELHADDVVVSFRSYGARKLGQEIAARAGVPLEG